MIERVSADGLLVYQTINLSKKVLTGQYVVVQVEPLQCRAEAEIRRNVACTARRSCLDVGTRTLVDHFAIKLVFLGVPVS